MPQGLCKVPELRRSVMRSEAKHLYLKPTVRLFASAQSDNEKALAMPR